MRDIIRFIAILVFVVWASLCFAVGANAQQVCISQEAANQCAANTRERDALKEENTILKAQLAEKDKSIKELQDANIKNVADLTDQNTKLLVDNARLIGENTKLEAEQVRLYAMFDVMLKNTRKRCVVSILFC